NAEKVSSKHVIIMDEVDGMSGNEDRGGMMELISFIKASKVPIICICNDRNHPKIRSLSNYCFDLRFQRPRVEQIKAAMMSIAFKENIQVAPNVLQDVIVAANQDIRQVLHNMSMWSARSKALSTEQTKSDIGKGTKHIKMGPFDVLREVFAIANNPKATIMDKSDLFFHDYSIAPLFVQENYVHVMPSSADGDKIKHLTLLSETADSICIGDIIDKQIRNGNNWSLLPTQAIFASVVPGELMKGHLRQMINFPAWLGKNSNRNHMDRVLQELHVHMRMRITGNKTDVALDYLPLLKRALTQPLIEKETEGVPEVLNRMEEYFLLREDFDSIIELSLWPGQTDPRSKIVTKVKSAFTRAYNKESGKNPYAVTNVKKKKKGAAATPEEELGEEDIAVNSEEEEDDSIENDAMIKLKKPTKKGAAATSEPSTSKEKKKNPSKRGGKSR
ncbi:Replication factor C subunit 1, partial [Araneus ventricosus]